MADVILVPHDPTWADEFEVEAARVREGLGDCVVAIHHIGSTSVPGLLAKPLLDLLVEVAAVEFADARNDEMRALGYRVRGEFGIPRRRFFTRDAPGWPIGRANVHSYAAGDREVGRHLLFRDVLRRDAGVREQYVALKLELQQRFPHDTMKYAEAKDGFVSVTLSAAGWEIG